MRLYHSKLRGFTIIELLVVIVIIGLLTGLATTSYINAQKNARDNTRKSGVASIATALESFYQTKKRFPGFIGNEGAAKLPKIGDRSTATWAGCLALDPTNNSVLYYSYPTTVGGTGDQLACNARTAAQGFDPTQYSPYPNWIPELGEYLNPSPTELHYQNALGNIKPLDDPDGTFSTQNQDVLGTDTTVGGAYAFVYRRLVGGYMVYARLENSTTDIPVGAAMTDDPKYPTGGGVTAYSAHTFMIRK